MLYLANTDPDNALAPLQAASATWRIAQGPRAGQKVLRLYEGHSLAFTHTTQALCVNAHGFSLHAGVRCAADDRQSLEQLCRYITRPAISNERLSINRQGQVVLKLKPVLSASKEPRGATAPATSCLRRWNSCSGWRHWCRARACI